LSSKHFFGAKNCPYIHRRIEAFLRSKELRDSSHHHRHSSKQRTVPIFIVGSKHFFEAKNLGTVLIIIAFLKAENCPYIHRRIIAFLKAKNLGTALITIAFLKAENCPYILRRITAIPQNRELYRDSSCHRSISSKQRTVPIFIVVILFKYSLAKKDPHNR